jgi:hypothetical protein
MILYKNDYALGAAVVANGCVLPTAFTEKTSNNFVVQNILYQYITGRQDEIVSINTNYKKDNDTYIFEFDVAEPTVYYLENSNYKNEYRIFLDNKEIDAKNKWSKSCALLPVGYLENGHHIISIKPEAPKTYSETNLSIGSITINDFQNFIEECRGFYSGNLKVENESVCGNVNVEKDSVLIFSIANIKGWSCIVNGEKIPITDFNGLISVPIKKGTNSIELTYKIPYLGVFISCTFIGLLFFIFYRYAYKLLKDNSFILKIVYRIFLIIAILICFTLYIAPIGIDIYQAIVKLFNLS